MFNFDFSCFIDRNLETSEKRVARKFQEKFIFMDISDAIIKKPLNDIFSHS